MSDHSVLTDQFEAWDADLRAALAGVYPDQADAVTARVIERARLAAAQRRPGLRRLDVERLVNPDWFQRPERVGYTAYADRFGGTFAGIARRIPYLRELGVDVLHLMSVATARAGDNDGGYAVDDYLAPQPTLGTADELVTLIDELRRNEISLCLDVVMNHTSRDHAWAVAARSGSVRHRAMYRLFADRREPDAYEASLPEVFPDMSPGNFTWEPELGGWVWTTFREFQWDLDWSNPDVLVEMVDVMLTMANRGVDVLRLDAVAFTWKRLGTNCQNQPEAHLIAQALRAALGMAAPASILLAEAIVGPDDLVGYLGRHSQQRRECELAYHNQLMVQGWSMLAERSVRQATGALQRLPAAPERAAWLTYVRCHDDIGWAVSDADAAAAGLDGLAHRQFLAAFYRGDFFGSFAAGTPFSSNAATGDERTCGMTATLSGLTTALAAGDVGQLATGIDRLVLLYAIAFGYGGIPLIYMGDELGQGDDREAAVDPGRAHDSRWLHRPAFDDAAATERHEPNTVPGQVWARLTRLAAARRRCLPLHAAGVTEPVSSGDDGVFAWVRRHPRYGTLVGLVNVTPERREVRSAVIATAGPGAVDQLAPTEVELRRLRPYQARWITAATTLDTIPPVP